MRTLLLLGYFVYCARAHVGMIVQRLGDGAPELCKDGNTAYAPEETWMKQDECAEKLCIVYHPGAMAILTRRCAAFFVSSLCKLLPPDIGKPYPDCCPRTVCP